MSHQVEGVWARDFAFVGAMTGFLAPFTLLRELPYALASAGGGALGGAVVGAVLGSLSGRVLHWPRGSLVVCAIVPGVLWGLSAAAASALIDSSVFGLSCVFACSAAVVQAMWLWPLYLRRHVAGQSPFVLLLAASFVSPLLGLVGFMWMILPKLAG